MSKAISAIVGCGVALLVFSNLAGKMQPIEIEPADDAESYRVRIVNGMDEPIRVKIMGYKSDAHYFVDLSRNESANARLYGGQRVLCVWDRDRELRIAAQLNVNRSGRLRIGRNVAAAARRDRTEGDEGSEAVLPELQIEEQ